MRLLLLFPSLFLAACTRQAVKPDLPATPRGIVEVPVEVYVPIVDELVAKCQWRRTAPLTEMPSVARERKGCLELYEANIDAIKLLRGKPAPTPALGPKREP